MNKTKVSHSIRNRILLIFIISLFISISCYGTVVFTNWIASAKKTAARISGDLNEDINNQVLDFMLAPYQINELNHHVIVNKMIDFADAIQRDRYFALILNTHSQEIYSLGYGTADGAYYGARRNEQGAVEIMRNNADTGGNSWYYSVNEDYSARELVLQAGKFDPRTRVWFQAAIEKGGPVFSPVYRHFVIEDLTVSAAWPIYGETGDLQGVLGTHLLLTGIGTFLKDAVEEYDGTAFIIEKESQYLIANSMDLPNFAVLGDGTLERRRLNDLDDPDIQKAYRQYNANSTAQHTFQGESGNYFINAREISLDGIDWVIISAIPQSFFIADVYTSITWAAVIATLSMLLVVLGYRLMMTKMMRPLQDLLQVTSELSAGDLTKRVEVIKNNELGVISNSVNRVADTLQSLIVHLETIVQKRTEELQSAFLSLEANKDDLRLILDSAAEAIYGIDLNGDCSFCNNSCIQMLGYHDQAELLGKNMHRLIHHSRADKTDFPIEECSIFRALSEGEGTHVEDEVFWRADGTSFSVEYFSFPQIKNKKIVGAVITFMDISERKQKEAEIQYLSCYDPLTGLQNRRCFEENRTRIDRPDNLPLSVVFADINGLKMTNDIFGHQAGDELIRKSAEILMQACRQNDVVARIGGDEFILLLPKTTRENAEKILDRIKAGFADARVEAIKCSISLGLDTKQNPDQSLDEVMANAENAMYKDKSMNRKSNNKDIIDTIINTLHAQNPCERQHSLAVAMLASGIGAEINLPENEILKLKQAGFLHDIGKIVLGESILAKDQFSEEELEKLKQHPSAGFRILSLFDDMLDIAEFVYGHHERWDGTGYPRGIKGNQISLISRILAVAEVYDRVRNRGDAPIKERESNALAVIKDGAGTQFDQSIAEAFLHMMAKMNREG